MNTGAVVATLLLILTTVAISWYARRYTGTTVEFYLAGRGINVFTNASAICGDYFSAASFLGVAGAVYASGMDGLWFGIGYAAGFVPVLLFFASPLRRFGEYTLPDFLAARFQSHAARLFGVGMIQVIALFYMAPQMMGAGTIWELMVRQGLFGLSPYATGVVMTVGIMIIYTAVGGMRGTTWNQAVQFWVLLTALILVVILGLLHGFRYGQALSEVSAGPLASPEEWRVADLLRPDPATGERPADRARAVTGAAYWDARVAPALSDPDARVLVLMPQRSRLHPDTPLTFNRPGHQYGPLDQISLVLTLVLGTSGLPHIMMRFYTNPSGPVARWTTVYVLVCASVFYTLATIIGVMGRSMIPGLPPAGGSAVFHLIDGVLRHPDMVLPLLAQRFGGSLALGYVAAAAFAAMFSTVGGLLMASAASLGHDLYEQYINPRAPEWQRVAVGRLALVFMACVAGAVGLGVRRLGLTQAYPAVIAMMVTWAFCIAASGFVPVLFTAIWWRQTTLRGALAGMLVGGGGAVLHIFLNLARVQGLIPAGTALARLLGQTTFPTLWTAPLAFLVIIGVSSLDRRHLPDNIDAIWMRIHGTARERQQHKLLRVASGR